jgi:uncharacterized membrane protein YeaQ/YmgE (transglycosylase-associated protein family)
MGILSWIVFGLIAGALARFLKPGEDPAGLIMTIVIGILGAVIGGFIGTQLGWGDVTGFNMKSFALAVGGGILLLAAYQMLSGNNRKT